MVLFWAIILHDLLLQFTDLDRKKKQQKSGRGLKRGRHLSVYVLGQLGPSLCGALWLAGLILWHPIEPCFLLIALTFNLMTALSASHNCSPHLLHHLPVLSQCIPFSFSSSCPYLVLPHGWFVIIHSPPPVKRIRLAINARLDKAGTSRVREEGLTDPDSCVIG